MAYRNGTYIAFHANNTPLPTESDMKYYNILRAWDEHEDIDFSITNSHDKTQAVRDSSKKETLMRVLKTRLLNSKNMLLIIGDTTRLDNDWIPFEIAYAVDNCEIPIIAAYTGYDVIRNPKALSSLWPYALASRIQNQTAHVIHIPFKKEPILDAISQFSHDKFPLGNGLGIYGDDTYKRWGII
jgi:hypothetical protein